MNQEQIAGIVLCAIGLVLSFGPTRLWKLTESWKSQGSSAPSDTYRRVIRVVGGATLGVGVLLLTGIVK